MRSSKHSACPGHRRRALIPLAATLAVFLASAAVAQTVQSLSPPPAEPAEALVSSRALIAALTGLGQPGFDETSLRVAPGQSSRASFPVLGSSVTLSGGMDDTVPRRAFGAAGKGGVAILLKLPATSAGLGSGDPGRDAVYALATVEATRVRVWALYTDMPSDAVLSRRIIAALAKLGPPLLTFDPAFQPAPGAVGADRYILK